MINHLLFMDDLKVYSEDEKVIELLLEVVHAFSKGIGMKFGLKNGLSVPSRSDKNQEWIEWKLKMKHLWKI